VQYGDQRVDRGQVSIELVTPAADFISRCSRLRFWARQEAMVAAVAAG